MSKYLTPAEVDDWADELERTLPANTRTAATLREYAAIVEAVSTDANYCHCLWFSVEVAAPAGTKSISVKAAEFQHMPDCIYLRAREARGYE